MIIIFRFLSLFEGLSFLVILSVTLGLVDREYVSILGMTHGVLFLLYLLGSLVAANIKKFSIIVWLGLFLAAFIPFAFIAVELLMRKSEFKKS
ncbi:MAG: DUF3817 domain-containing protein [Saccharospirillaceae bacterium]|nr:DUF3817 domain-containing protein [Pseudomonadales bacterium]NRB80464.1 DUF3817 domain-containing protein [Saccharospirillaceae bacterium]